MCAESRLKTNAPRVLFAKTETVAYKFYRKLGFEYFVEAHEKEDFGDRETVPMYLDLLRESIQ